MWWNDIRANISFLRPEESIKLKNLPITTSELRTQFYAQDKQVEFEEELVDKCGFSKDLAERIATCMWKALQGDSYFIETLQKEKETRKGMIMVGEVYIFSFVLFYSYYLILENNFSRAAGSQFAV